jgi:hypothetical protein
MKLSFAISGVAIDEVECSIKIGRLPYYILKEAVALKAGALLNDSLVEITAPSLGQWLLFYAAGDLKKHEWVISNNKFLVEKLQSKWLNISCSARQIMPGEYLTLCALTGRWEQSTSLSSYSLEPLGGINLLSNAISTVEESLQMAARDIAKLNKPALLLLSAGVDSGLLCSFLKSNGANIRAISIKTPWGDELEGAQRTADHCGIPLTILELCEKDLVDGIKDTLLWLQDCDSQTTIIQLLVSIAYRYAQERKMDLITGMGSDLLNSINETGMNDVADGADRIISVSRSGLMQTNGLAPVDESKIHHPYWQPATISAQLAVAPRLKSANGHEKYYLRVLAERRLPKETAWGIKTAIHRGSNLEEGLSQAVSPLSLDAFLLKKWQELKGALQ